MATTTVNSMLPTPPNSPSLSSRKPVDSIAVAIAEVLPETLPSPPVNDCSALSQQRPTPPPDNATSSASTTPSPPVTPDKRVVVRSTPSRTLATLKKDLHIEGWQCGAQTKRQTRCRLFIKCCNRDLIDAQLNSMTSMTASSPHFESAAYNLVKLVHCHLHIKNNKSTEDRLDTWRLAFPPRSPDDSALGISVEELIREALGPFRTQCHAQEEKECKRIGGQKVQNCERTLQELIKPEIYSDSAKLELLLKALEWNRTCIDHERSEKFRWVAAWKESIVAVLPLPIVEDGLAVVSDALEESSSSPKVFPGSPITLTPLTNETTVTIAHALPTPDPDPALYWPKAYDTSPFNILQHINHRANLEELIGNSLCGPDLKAGYVYAYEVPGNEGYVKIGFTNRSLTERHDEWSFDCNRLTKPIYPSTAQIAAAVSDDKMSALEVPHARRVEALCHAELSRRSIRIYCSACLKQHKEWFEVSAEEVTAVIQKWSRWMATRPYVLSKNSGTLKVDERNRMHDFNRFLREVGEVPAVSSAEGEGIGASQSPS
ncbi:DUF1766-domain-containing protein [Aaosphaeria arxii CBS 175.79]|uniref:DUF1766-domain-containing protein n=1 Tax=Aaosphaeria arxii CBS 175.79 TaxID=1450172 RepID=A0A6A5XB24_9PLEO|nr:DUF1766-domain-containing protein [Aaosphaeria arxii CBS 175.79]KAF2010178.1 DUF1766-domain-containing protein [Aaosphaeria arxii CBS 175.79]